MLIQDIIKMILSKSDVIKIELETENVILFSLRKDQRQCRWKIYIEENINFWNTLNKAFKYNTD